MKKNKKKATKKASRERWMRVFTQVEIDELIAAAKRFGYMQLAALIAVMRSTGIRPGELLQSQWSSFDKDTGLLLITTKTDKARQCALVEEGLAALKECRRPSSPWLLPSDGTDDKPIAYSTINDQWRIVVQAAGIKKNKDGSQPVLYSLRHTLATRLALDLNFSPMQLATWMGFGIEQASRVAAKPYIDPDHVPPGSAEPTGPKTKKTFNTLTMMTAATGIAYAEMSISDVHELMDHLYPGILTSTLPVIQPHAAAAIKAQVPELEGLLAQLEEFGDSWGFKAELCLRTLGPTVELEGPVPISGHEIDAAYAAYDAVRRVQDGL